MRPRRRFLPEVRDTLEPRMALSGGLHAHAAMAHHARGGVHVRPYRPTVGSIVLAEINQSFDALTADVHRAQAVLAQSLANQAAIAAARPTNVITIIFPNTAPSDNTGVQFQSYMTGRVALMDRDLLTELNALPIHLSSKVPGVNPVQLYVNDALVGTQQPSLMSTLPAFPEPTANETAFELYTASVDNAIATQRAHLLNGVTQLFLGRNVLPPYLQPLPVAVQRG